MSAEDNKIKALHGQKARKSLKSIIESYKDKGCIFDVKKNFRTGYKNYYQKQFFAPFLITFEDGEKWAVYSASSTRDDRTKGNQWDAYNLKKIDSSIKTGILVYPEPLVNKKISSSPKNIVTALDYIVNQEQFCNLIEDKICRGKCDGAKYDLKGKSYENRIVDIMNCEDNLSKIKTGNKLLVGVHYDCFSMIIKTLNIKPENILMINASCDKKKIGCLPSGGFPKTDVIVNIKFIDESTKIYTFSCKRTNSSSVSVHQYPAKTFSEVLDADNQKLKVLLENFQKAGGIRAFGVENAKELTEELKSYVDKLGLWVLGGYGIPGISEKLCAQYLLTYSDIHQTMSIYSVQDYYKKLKDNIKSGQFGTVFQWTFASGQKGKSIQLKVKII